MRIFTLLLMIVALTFGTVACESKDKEEEKSEEGGEGNESSGEESGGEDPGDEAAGEGGEEAEGEEAAGEGGEEAAADAVGPEDSPNEGDSCEGLVSSADSLMACNGQKLMFCSSYSDYKWKMTQECPEGKTCTVSEDMNQGSCK